MDNSPTPLILSLVPLDQLADALITRLVPEIESKLITNKQKKESEDYISREQAAKKLGNISLPTLAKFTLDGTIKAYRIGNRVLYRPSDIDAAVSQIKTNIS